MGNAYPQWMGNAYNPKTANGWGNNEDIKRKILMNECAMERRNDSWS